MVERKNSGKKTKYIVCFAVLWFLQMAAAFWFCTRKQGFHEDEFYTYYSTARTNGFYVEDGAWMERDAYRNEFVVLPGERFRYGRVMQVQSWDVHPPMYYWVFHTAASLVPGVFSKWIGLSVNLLFHGINLALLTYLSYLAAGKDMRLPLLVTFVYGFGPAAMSGVVFIRMYEMLTTFVLLCAVLHVRAVQRLQGVSGGKEGGREADAQCGSRLPVRTLLGMAAVTYVGFLTQYYYFIFLFFLAIAFGLWLLRRDRAIGNCLRYGLFQGLAFVLAYLTYPAFPGQMFRGQRGAQATENFFDLSNTFERISFFWDLMNRYVFGGMLGLMVLFLAAAAVAGVWQRRSVGAAPNSQDGQCAGQQVSGGVPFYMLLFTAAGYFLAVSKTALLLGETSNRYQLPIYGITVLLLFLAMQRLVRWRFSDDSRPSAGVWITEENGSGKKGRLPVQGAGYGKGMAGLAAAFCVALVALGYVRAGVVFLYPEDREQTVRAEERAAAHTPAVYFYRPGEEWCIWDVTDELLAYPEVYFVAVDSAEPIVDEKIENAGSLVVYLAKGADVSEQLARLPQSAGASVQSGLQPVFEEKYCDVYDLTR